ncbi:MAG: FmdE family protein [Thermodesulfobacteriota bacterium]
MNAETIMNENDFKRCAEFHGHVCPGLSIGYRAAKLAMEKLGLRRSKDEEVVAIVETDACSADAVQVLTGCTFGKGNFIYRDYGKHVLTLVDRKSGKAVRVVAKPNALAPDPTHMALIQKVLAGTATAEEEKVFAEKHEARSRQVLEAQAETLFDVRFVDIDVPKRARIEPGKPCEGCQESVMQSKLVEIGGKRFCRECAGKEATA